MKRYGRITLGMTLAMLAGCGMHTSLPDASGQAGSPTMAVVAPALPGQTTLLVSLEDGTIIKQVIDIDADICFKQNSASSTTCFTQGAAIVDPVSNIVVGYEMIEDHIELIAKSD